MTALKAAFMQANGAEQLHCINTSACKWDSDIFVTGNVLKEKSALSCAFRAAFPASGASPRANQQHRLVHALQAEKSQE